MVGAFLAKAVPKSHRIIQDAEKPWELLREKQPCGKYVAYSGEKLAAKLGIVAGENAVSEAIKRFWDTVVERLEAKGIVCGRKDVLLSGSTGYRLAKSIMVRGEPG
jgi:hypothetical protein